MKSYSPPQYALTAIDPDFKPKGSRDPLGFQSIWIESARKLIKDLSTVSSNIIDFKILCYAKYFFHEVKRQKDERLFLPFFLRLEQAYAYARYVGNKDLNFNGISVVSKRANLNPELYSISNTRDDTILSNQRSYGIYGKYIRPVRDMKLFEDENFNTTFKTPFTNEVLNIFEKLFNQKSIQFPPDSLRPLSEMLKRITTQEQKFFRKTILIGLNEEHPQNSFYNFLIKKNDWNRLSEFNLFNYLNSVKATSKDDSLNYILEEIINTEKVLAPLSYKFTCLLSKGIWTIKDIENNEVINQHIDCVSYNFASKTLVELNQMLSFKGVELVEALIHRNSIISKRRNGSAWIDRQEDKFVVYYGEIERSFNEMKESYWENSYFIQTYLRLYESIEKEC